MRLQNAAAALNGELVTVARRHRDGVHYVVTLNSNMSPEPEQFGVQSTQLIPVGHFDEGERLAVALNQKIRVASLRSLNRVLMYIAKTAQAYAMGRERRCMHCSIQQIPSRWK